MAATGRYHPSSQMFDRKLHEERLNNASKSFEARKATANMQISWGSNDPKARGRSAALKGLKTITLSELELGEVHHGRVLYGRLSAKAFKMAAVHTVLEDEFGRGVRVSVYDAVSPIASPEETEALFPVGMKVAIKEPYFKWALDGETVVRVDNPANVVRIANDKDNDPKLKREEAEEAPLAELLEAVRREGNKHFSKEDWIGAVFQYSLCIDAAVDVGESLESMSDSFKDVIKLAYSNRAEALLRLKEFDGALSDATKALELDPTHLKSFSRQGRAAMEVGLYEEACEAFAAVLGQCPDERSARENLRLCRERLVQGSAGNRDKESDHFPREDYVGPVEIRRVDYGDGRRGLFAKDSIKVHTMFLVSNAMAAVTKHPGGDRVIYDMSSVDSSDGSNGACSLAHDHNALVQLLERAAKSKRSKAQLHSLATAGKEEMEVPSMELFKPGSEWASRSASTLKFDVSHIKEIVRLNSFSYGHSEVPLTSANDGKDESAMAGLWILPSFMNHSCVPNCTHISIGNVKYVRAARDIEAGEELTISYFRVLFAGVEDRARKLSFKCRCERCFLEKQLDAEFSQINTRVGVLVPRSKQEFANDPGRFGAIKESGKLLDEAADLVRLLNRTEPKLNTHRKGGARAGFLAACLLDGKYLATRELADLANRVEALLGSVDMEVAAHQRGWIRAGFLEAYLAKYQLATLREMDASARIDTLSVIVDSMISVLATVGTDIEVLAHLLLHEVKGRYNKKSKTYKTAQDLIRRVIRSLYEKDLRADIWRRLMLMDPEFDYCTFSFNNEQTTLEIPPFFSLFL